MNKQIIESLLLLLPCHAMIVTIFLLKRQVDCPKEDFYATFNDVRQSEH